MDNKDRIIKFLALALLIVVSIAIYQRTAYEDELSALKSRITSDSLTIKHFQK